MNDKENFNDLKSIYQNLQQSQTKNKKRMQKQKKYITNNDFSIKYQIIRELYHTNLSTIYVAQSDNNKVYYIKEVRLLKNEYDQLVNKFTICSDIQELNGQNLVKIIDIITNQDRFYQIMDFYLDNLRTFLQQNFSIMKLNEKLALCQDLAQGIYNLHKKGITHCDISPDNLLIRKEKDKIILELTNFESCSKLELMESQVGTSSYTAPEVIEKKIYTNQIDVFSFGCVVYFIFINKELIKENEKGFNSIKNYQLVNMGCKESDQINQLIIICTDIDPERRPKIQEICKILKNIQDTNYDSISLDSMIINSFIY